MRHTFDFLSGVSWQSVVVTCGIILVTLVIAMALYLVLFSSLRLARLTAAPLATLLVQRLREPSRMLIPLIALMLVIPSLELPAGILAIVQHLLSLCIIAGITWVFINATRADRDHILSRYCFETKDDLKARTVQTQLTVAFKIVLASAGIIGITVGFAAQRSIATLVAGLQIAIMQPIRIKDVVLVEGE